MSTTLAFYEEKVQYYINELTKLRPYATGVAVLRMTCFGGFAWGVYKWASVHSTAWIMTTLLLAIVFATLVRIAWRLNDRKALLEKLLFINNNELNVLQNKPNQFDNGGEFLSYGSISGDLDVFGPGSLFLLLNRTTTWHGTKQLADLLNEPLLNTASIDDQQQAVRALSTQRALGQLLTAHGLLNGEKEGNLNEIGDWLLQPQVIYGNRFINVLRFLTPLYSSFFLVYWLATGNYALLIPVIFINWGIIGRHAKRIQQQHTLLGKKEAILNQYATILSLFAKVETSNSVLLKKEKDKAAEAHHSVKKLSRLSAMFDQRLNLFINIFLNSFFMYDIQCLWALESWKQQHKDRFNEWIHTVGMIESLNSLSTLAYNNPAYQYATTNTDTLSISATQMAHPLIPAEGRVANDCSFGTNEQLVLVTGSNMSGKTTFLRTLGINLILAQCGAPVCATTFSFTPMVIRGSIRVSDSLQEQTSYFMAELKRLQQIIHFLQQQTTPVLILIDEILRGTNSEDKTYGSEQFIKKLIRYRCLTLFATHDLTLSRLEAELPGQVSNYCFESTIRNGELLFDYTLQRGVAKNKNASFLMEKMEII
ncbi:MAG: MutS-related protein [Niastella sp.]|uniref:MutS-related protein n=1 Tax=Niastella sp. TaxID=1869183 RepID=UPI003899D7C0